MGDDWKGRRTPLLASLLRAYARTNLRGGTRLTLLLARHLKSLPRVSIQVADWPPIYMDMRSLSAPCAPRSRRP